MTQIGYFRRKGVSGHCLPPQKNIFKMLEHIITYALLWLLQNLPTDLHFVVTAEAYSLVKM